MQNNSPCAHCSFPIYAPVRLGSSSLCFCCTGCREVYLLLHELAEEGG